MNDIYDAPRKAYAQNDTIIFRLDTGKVVRELKKGDEVLIDGIANKAGKSVAIVNVNVTATQGVLADDLAWDPAQEAKPEPKAATESLDAPEVVIKKGKWLSRFARVIKIGKK